MKRRKIIMTTAMKKNAPKFIDDSHVQVTKEFAKNARIFGTPEYKQWREIKQDCPNAQMVTKTIRKNPDKKVSTKNMTYERMADYIRVQENAEELMAEFEKQIALSKIQTNPYRCVLAWFLKTFENYDNYKEFFDAENKKVAEQKSIFRLVSTTKAVFEGEENQNDLPCAANQ